uniref:Transposase n=1 Tax=Desulfacinum infernum TaxID=35837 RepID=A0A831ZXS2_9BACT
MITITPSMRLLVATQPVDFRKGIDGLCRLCRTHLGEYPFSGTVFVFFNILLWNGDMRGAGCAPFWKKIAPT